MQDPLPEAIGIVERLLRAQPRNPDLIQLRALLNRMSSYRLRPSAGRLSTSKKMAAEGLFKKPALSQPGV